MNPIKNYRTVARLALGAVVAGYLLVPAVTTQAATYSYTELLPSGFFTSYASGISGSQQVGSCETFGNNLHAFMWSGAASNAVDLHPSGFTDSSALGISGSQQVGFGGLADYADHALLWSGTASSVVDLNGSGLTVSFGSGISGGQQVGDGWGPATGYGNHALLWSGTASSVVDLNPSGFTFSQALGISGSHQVGFGTPSSNGYTEHALLWSGTASSAVDLHPRGFTHSRALGVSGGQQVGYGDGPATGDYQHALLWSGTADSVVDLTPNGYIASGALANSGSQQVGVGALSNNIGNWHALVWSGSASNFVDLHSFLPSDYDESYACGIDSDGSIVGYASNYSQGVTHAILWKVVHESVVVCNDSGQCGAIVTYSTGAGTICSPPSGSFFPVGTNTVTCTSTNPTASYTFTVTVKDCEAPVVSCRPLYKPLVKGNAKSEKDSERKENADGLFQLLGRDNCDPNSRLYILDSVSGLVAGPFANGDLVKITKKQGRQESDDAKDSKNSAVVAHIRLQGNGLLYGVDASGNVGTSVLCGVAHGRYD